MVGKIKVYSKLLRTEQWVKNLFLFAPLVFSKHLFEIDYVVKVIIAFGTFCISSSIVYVVNDIIDREADRLHPKKKSRPIAAGLVTIPHAIIVIIILFVALIFFLQNFVTSFIFTAVLYLILNLLYSFFLKRIVLVDVFIIASGFMLRVLAGAFAIEVVISHWLVLCTLFLSLFLAISKRRSELLLTSEQHVQSGRVVLQLYTVDFLDQLMTIIASGVAISYALYTVAERTIKVFGTENLIFTTIFVLFGLFRYIYLMRLKKVEDNLVLLIAKDVPLLINVIVWFLACIVIIYFKEIMEWIKL